MSPNKTTCICTLLFTSNEEVESCGSSNVVHLRKRTKRVAATSELDRNMGLFLSLLASACNGEDMTMGLPSQHDFWTKFAEKLDCQVGKKWTASTCEEYGYTVWKLYFQSKNIDLKDSSLIGKDMAKLMNTSGSLLEEIFEQHGEYFSSWEVLQTQVVVVDDEIKRVSESPARSTSSVKRVLQFKYSCLPEETEGRVYKQLTDLVKSGLLHLAHIVFAESFFLESVWGTNMFLNFESAIEKSNFIKQAMKDTQWMEKRSKIS